MAEAAVATVRFLELPLDLIVNLPGLIPLWKSGGVCSLVTGGHSLLQNCGSEVLSLDEMYYAIGRSSAHFWHILSKLAVYIRQGVASKDSLLREGQDMLVNIVDGAAIVGANTKYMMFRNRFLQTLPSAIMTPLDKVTGTVTSVLPMSLGVVNALPLTASKWVYNVARYTVIDIIKISANQQLSTDEKIKRLGVAFLNQMYAGKQRYHDECVAAQLSACDGVALMMQYSNPAAQFVRMQCRAVPLAVEGLYDMFLGVTVDAYITRLICVDGLGSNVFTQIMSGAYSQAPLAMQPMLMSYIQSNTDTSFICQSMLTQTKRSITNSMQPWFSAQFASSESLGSLIDYLAKLFGDEEAGMCLDFTVNPHITVLIPTPVDYFRACARTTLCKTKCGVEFAAFQRAKLLNEQSSLTSTLLNTAVVESKIFTDADQMDWFVPMNILAVVELSDCSRSVLIIGLVRI